MDQDLQVKIKVQVTQNLINRLKSKDRNVTDYDTWIRNYRYLLLRAQRAPNSGSVKMVCKVRKNYWKLCHLIYTRTYYRYIPVTTKTQLSDNVSVCTPLHLTPHMQWISAVYSPGCRQSQSQSHRDGPPVGPGPAPQPPSDRPRSSPYPPARINRTLCVVESDWRWRSPGLYKTEYMSFYVEIFMYSLTNYLLIWPMEINLE